MWTTCICVPRCYAMLSCHGVSIPPLALCWNTSSLSFSRSIRTFLRRIGKIYSLCFAWGGSGFHRKNDTRALVRSLISPRWIIQSLDHCATPTFSHLLFLIQSQLFLARGETKDNLIYRHSSPSIKRVSHSLINMSAKIRITIALQQKIFKEVNS